MQHDHTAATLPAREAFDALGWPTTRAEAWRYFPVRAFEGHDLAAPFQAGAVPEAAVAGEATLTLVGGRLDRARSSLGPWEGYIREETGARGPARAEGWHHGLEAANAAFSAASIQIEVPAGVALDVPLRIRQLAVGAGALHPRIALSLGARSHARVLVEHRGEGECLTNAFTAVQVGEGATLEQIIVVAADPRALHMEQLDVALQRGATWRAFVCTARGGAARTSAFVRLEGEGAEAHVDGLYLPTGEGRFDHHVDFQHLGARTVSQATWAGAIDQRATGTFLGCVRIGQEVRGCSTRQLTRSLLLSPSATANAKPELHIDCDEVEASHGATIGQLDARQLFYLVSRGIAPEDARAMLIRAFIGGAILRAPAFGQAAIRDALGGLGAADAEASE